MPAHSASLVKSTTKKSEVASKGFSVTSLYPKVWVSSAPLVKGKKARYFIRDLHILLKRWELINQRMEASTINLHAST